MICKRECIHNTVKTGILYAYSENAGNKVQADRAMFLFREISFCGQYINLKKVFAI